MVFAIDLTLDGHAFLAAMEVKPIWGKLKETFTSDELAVMPVKVLAEVAKDLAKDWAKKKLGLDG